MTVNPFLAARERELARTAPPVPDEEVEDSTADLDPWLEETRGPQSPLNVAAEGIGPADALPLGPALVSEASVLYAGVHGGAGVTTLIELMPEGVEDARREWPATDPWTDTEGAVVLVARSHIRGLSALRDVLTAWHAGAYSSGRELAGVCIVDDGPRLTKAQTAEIRRCMAMAPHGWRIAWHEDFRFPEGEAPRATGHTKRTLRSIRKTAERLCSGKETK